MNDFTHEIAPAETLEDRVVAALRDRGLIGRRRPARAARLALAAAAAVILVAAGYGLGVWHAQPRPAAAPAGPRFVLLLHDTPSTRSPGVPQQVLVDEYRNWARGVSAEGHAITGEKLKDVDGHTLGGFFIVEAPTLEAARAIADSCPHVRYGGRIDVREIEPT
jgi:hypothetical protein